MIADAIANGFLLENGEKRSDMTASESAILKKGHKKGQKKGQI